MQHNEVYVPKTEHQQKVYEQAMESWQESEWVLNVLRIKQGTSPMPKSEKEIVEWYQRN